LAARLVWKLNQCGDASIMLDVVRANTATWSGSKVLLFARLPKPQQGLSVASDDDRSLLHTSGLRLVWPLLQTLQVLTASDKTRSVHLLDIHPLKNRRDETWLNENFGPAFMAPLTHYRSTTRVHHMRTNLRMPPGANVRHTYTPIDLQQSLDGWKWTPTDVVKTDGAQLSMSSAPHHTVVKAASESVFSGTTLPPLLQQELQTQTMTHTQAHEQRRMSVRMWMHFLHLRGTPAGDALLETYPCFRMMIQATGQKVPEHFPTAFACGTGRWCQHCENGPQFARQVWAWPFDY